MALYSIDDLCHMIDHSNLKPNVTEREMARLCGEAAENHFKIVAVSQTQVSFCAEQLAGTGVGISGAISFPSGQTSIYSKVVETRDSLNQGATEVDFVLNLTQVLGHNWDYVTEEMGAIVAVCREAGVPSKVIFENCYLSQEEKLALCQIAREVRPTFVKTSTGYGTGGATVEDVRLMRANVGDEVQVKAAGGIRDADTFLELVRAGATRIGCSAGIPIIAELRRRMEASGTDTIEL